MVTMVTVDVAEGDTEVEVVEGLVHLMEESSLDSRRATVKK